MGLWRRRHKADKEKQELSEAQKKRASKKGGKGKGKAASKEVAQSDPPAASKEKDGSVGQAKA